MSDFDDRFAQLRARFAERGQQEATELERLAADGDWSGVRDLAHGLAGRAGMFGYGDLGELARAVEESVDAGGEPKDQAMQLAASLRAVAQER